MITNINEFKQYKINESDYSEFMSSVRQYPGSYRIFATFKFKLENGTRLTVVHYTNPNNVTSKEYCTSFSTKYGQKSKTFDRSPSLSDIKNWIEDEYNESIKESKINTEKINEGTWAFKKEHIPTLISELEALQKKYWNLVGDDILMDGIDKAIERAKTLNDYVPAPRGPKHSVSNSESQDFSDLLVSVMEVEGDSAKAAEFITKVVDFNQKYKTYLKIPTAEEIRKLADFPWEDDTEIDLGTVANTWLKTLES